MKLTSKILVVITLLLSAANTFGQISNQQSVSVKISGNCEMCKKTIETAANIKGIAAVEWNKETKMATISYNNQKTNTNEILKRIALAGYDNEQFLAPGDACAKLPECCQYVRVLKPAGSNKDVVMVKNEHSGRHTQASVQEIPNATQLDPIFDFYFALKDALIKSDGNATALKAQELLVAIKAVSMDKLAPATHTTWMKLITNLSADAANISKSKDVSQQRTGFASLSKSVYELMKTTKPNTPVYYQHCPMYDNGKGANWLSKENNIRNPYYGAKMMTCGSTLETLNKEN